jgi:hypothetical protein
MVFITSNVITCTPNRLLLLLLLLRQNKKGKLSKIVLCLTGNTWRCYKNLRGFNQKLRKERKFGRFDVRKSVHHHTIQINQPTICNSFTSLLLDFFVWLNTFRASPRPSSGAYNCTKSIWFYRWREAAGAASLQR